MIEDPANSDRIKILYRHIAELEDALTEKARLYSESTEALVCMRLRAEKAEADIRSMVKKAADNELGGYRELGERAAKAELRAEKAEANAERETACANKRMIHAGELQVEYLARAEKAEAALAKKETP